MFHEFFLSIRLAIKNLRSNLVRTFLSLLGIVIGVMSVVLVLSLGAGVKDFVVSQVESFGSDIIQIEIKVPKVKKTSSQNAGGLVGGTQITTLKLDDAEEVSKLSNIGDWYAGLISQQISSYENKNKQAMIFGVTSGISGADEQVRVVDGEMFSEEDEDGLRQVAVLGSEIKEYFFGDSPAVGQNIKLGDKTFRVIGVLDSRGTSGFFNFDNTIYLPLETLQKKIMGIDYIQFAIFRIRDMDKLDLTIAEATDIMREQHDIADPEDDDFAVNSIVEIKDILDTVFGAVDLLLLALVSISLVVGGVGIMNVMYVAVSERTFEIGLRKAVGARNREILKQFLFEAILLTLFGGIAGIFLGAGLTFLATVIISSFGIELDLKITLQAIVIGLVFSLLSGIAFGFFPARNASRLSPMEALRKE